jgi:hypothetical protein
MADGKKGLDYQSVSDVQFTADGKAVYVATNNGKNYMVVGEDESNGFATIAPRLVKSALIPGIVAGNKVGFVGMATAGAPDQSVVVGDAKPLVRRRAANLALSPDGSRYAFTWADGVNIDGVDQETALKPFYQLPYDDGTTRGEGQVLFSPDSKHVLYFGSPAGGDTFGVIIDGKFFAAGRGIPSVPTFTPDSKHVFWEDREEGGVVAVYLDGKVVARVRFEGQGRGAGGWWEMAPDGVLSVLTQDGDTMKRLRITPTADSSIDTLLAAAKPLPKK